MPDQLLKMIESYLQGCITLSYFEGWFMANRQRVLGSGDRKAVELASKVDAGLARFSEGKQSDCIRECFRSYIINVNTGDTINVPLLADKVTWPIR